MQQPVYATIGAGVVNTAFTVVSVSIGMQTDISMNIREPLFIYLHSIYIINYMYKIKERMVNLRLLKFIKM